MPEAVKHSASGATLPSVKMVTVVEHPVAQHALTMLRNKQTPPHQFRTFSNQLLVALVMEATRSLPTRAESVAAAGQTALGHVIAKPIVFLAVARSGLGLAHRMVEFFPDLLVGTISYDVSAAGQTPDPRLHLPNAPALRDARVIVFDPIVATGASASLAISLVRRTGASDISLVSFLVSAPGLNQIQENAPDLRVWTASIEPKLDARRGPMPGVGDFPARLFG